MNGTFTLPCSDDARKFAEAIQGHGALGLAEAMRKFTAPVSLLFAQLVTDDPDRPGRIEASIWQRVTRAAYWQECALLECEAGTSVMARKGRMFGGGARRGLVAQVESLVIPACFPPDARRTLRGDLHEDTPAGLVMDGLTRQGLGASPYMGGVVSTSRLYNQLGVCVMWAWEHVQPWLCEQLRRPPVLAARP